MERSRVLLIDASDRVNGRTPLTTALRVLCPCTGGAHGVMTAGAQQSLQTYGRASQRRAVHDSAAANAATVIKRGTLLGKAPRRSWARANAMQP